MCRRAWACTSALPARRTCRRLQDLQAEIGDRFGALPPAANNLLQTARLTLRCRELGVRRMDVGTQSSYLQFDEDNRVDSARVIALIQREPRVFRLEGSLKLRVSRGARAARPRGAGRRTAGPAWHSPCN